MKRLLPNFLWVIFMVCFSLCMTSCDKDDEPKLSAKHSMILGKWKFIKSTMRCFYRDPDTGEEILDAEEVTMIRGDETWEFSDRKVTVTAQFVQDPTIPPIDFTIPDEIWEYRYEEEENELWMSCGMIWKILKLTPKEMILYGEVKRRHTNMWFSLTDEFERP